MTISTSPAGQWRPESLLESVIHTDLFYMVLLSAKTLIHSSLLRPNPALSTKNTNKNRLPAGSSLSAQAVHRLTSDMCTTVWPKHTQTFSTNISLRQRTLSQSSLYSLEMIRINSITKDLLSIVCATHLLKHAILDHAVHLSYYNVSYLPIIPISKRVHLLKGV